MRPTLSFCQSNISMTLSKEASENTVGREENGYNQPFLPFYHNVREILFRSVVMVLTFHPGVPGSNPVQT